MPPSPRLNLWPLLDALPTPVGVAAAWHPVCGTHFDALTRAGVFILTGQQADEYPCAHAVPCPCLHRIDPGPGSRRARCTCEPADCPPFTVEPGNRALYRLNIPGIAVMVRRAYGLKGGPPRPVAGLARTYELGAWYPEPGLTYRAFACLALDPSAVTAAAHALSAAAPAPFAFLYTTSGLLTAEAERSVAKARGICHCLADTTRLTPDYALETLSPPAQLLAPLHTKAITRAFTLSDVEKTFELADKLNVRVRRGPTGREFMDFYCRDNMELRRIARQRPGWTYGTIRNVRDRLIRNGIDLEAVRAYFHRDVEAELDEAGLAAPGVYRKGLAEE